MRITEEEYAALQDKMGKAKPRAKPKKRGPSELEETFAMQLRMLGQEGWVEEFQFHPARKWRLDFAHPAYKIGVECEGGTWVNGRHNRGSSIEKDMEKYNQAAILGWCVLRFTKAMLDKGMAIDALKELLPTREEQP